VPKPAAVKLGTFTLAANGTVSFTASAVTPVIVIKPASTTTVARGGSTTLSVTADGATSYQWYLNGVAIAGATGSSLTISNAQQANQGGYTVVASNATYGTSVTSTVAAVKVSTTYVEGDLQVVFHQSGASDVEYNIGSVSNFLGLAAGTVVPVNLDTNLVATNFSGTLSGVSFSVVSAGASRLWLSDANTNTAPADFSAFTHNVIANKIATVGADAAAISTFTPLVISASDPNSYSYIVSDNTANISQFDGNTPFLVDAASDAVTPTTLAFYQFVPTATVPKPSAVKLGTFTLAANGTLNFTASAVTPAIVAKPVGTTITRGNNATLSVTADGATSYQWYQNGVAIAGATGSSLTISNAQFANIGSYTVVASNSTYATSVTSPAAAVKVTAPYVEGDLQVVFHQSGASDVEYNIGSVSNFLGLTSGTVVPVAVDANLVATNFGGTLSGVSFSVVSAGASKLWLSDASLVSVPSVFSAFTHNVIANKIATVGADAAAISTFTPLVISASDPNSYSYIVSDNTANISQFDGNTPFVVDATSDGLNPASAAFYQFAPSAIVPKPAAGLIGSFTLATNGTLTFKAGLVPTPAIATQPVSTTNNAGTTATFTVTAAGGVAPSYQWYKGATAIAGATTPTLTLNNVQGSNAANYSVVLSTLSGSVTSSVASLTVIVPPVIATSPASVTNNAGTTATFTVTTSSGTAPFTYTWYKASSIVSGATTATLTLSNVFAADAGNYTVVVANAAGSVTSSVAALTVIEPIIVSQPASVSVKANSNAVFTVSAVGTGLTYQWKQNTSNAPYASSHSATLTVTNASLLANGYLYSVVVSNSLGQFATSANAALGVTASGLPITIATQPLPQTKLQGQIAIFKVVATGAAPFSSLSYQWKLNGTAIPGATFASYTNSFVNTNAAGNYSVTISNAVATTNSLSVALVVNLETNKPTVVISAPLANFETTNSALTVNGTATDNARVSQVVVINTTTHVTNNATVTLGATPAAATWTNIVTLATGTNALQVYSVDFAGNTSAVATRNYFLRVPSTFTIVTNTPDGSGGLVTITPALPAYVGRTYYISATPNATSVLSNIVNVATSGTTVITNLTPLKGLKSVKILAETNNLVTINFATNRFGPVAGNYSGLFLGTPVAQKSAGFIKITTTAKLAFTGSLFVDGDAIKGLKGALNLDGTGTITVLRTNVGKPALTVTVQLGFDNTLSGSVSNATDGWTSAIDADRAAFSAAVPTTTLNGKYTVLLPGFTNATDGPIGDGYAALTVAGSGAVTALGFTADNQAFKPQLAPVSGTGRWPVYAPLYVTTGGAFNGSVIGWVYLTNNAPTSTFTGDLAWIKTGWTNGYYNGGFTNLTVAAEGSVFTPLPNLAAAGFLKGATATYASGEFANLTDHLDIVGAALKATNSVPVGKVLTLTLGTGVFSETKSTNYVGNVLNPIKGALLQNQQRIGGYFLGTSQAGQLLIQ
jgi:hypothetical protein